jgi:hypothetical protein
LAASVRENLEFVLARRNGGLVLDLGGYLATDRLLRSLIPGWLARSSGSQALAIGIEIGRLGNNLLAGLGGRDLVCGSASGIESIFPALRRFMLSPSNASLLLRNSDTSI